MTPDHTANPGYAVARLERALATALDDPDPATRARAQTKVERWRAVLAGMASGSLVVGSRTPVADTPAWVTLEVAHGGFATGRYLAEGELGEHEHERLAALPDAVPGDTPRERLNHWFLGDDGQVELGQALERARYRVDLPEEGALPVVVALLARGHERAALALLTELRPLMHRLRFYPRLIPNSMPSGACVRLSSIDEVVTALRDAPAQAQVEAMNEALRVWNPLFDRALALWVETVVGELPDLAREADGSLARKADGQPQIVGQWPCKIWPDSGPNTWAARGKAWLADYRQAAAAHSLCAKHRHPRSNFSRLRAGLERVDTVGPAGLTGREVGSIRLGLANTIAKLGPPGSPARAALRAIQAEVSARPSKRDLSEWLISRALEHPGDGGLPTLEPLSAPAREGEHDRVPPDTPAPAYLIAKFARALEAPIAELIEREVIGSAEVLAIVLPQITAQIAAAGIVDPVMRELYGQIYAAFRRRRSLLLLNLEHQVQLDELPWVAALEPLRSTSVSTQASARQTLEQVTLLALSAFPHTIVPNPLVSEMRALAERAGLEVPFVEEIAADIFMGTFTAKWLRAAQIALQHLEGTLYARYYDLPGPGDASLSPTKIEPAKTRKQRKQRRKAPADGFAALCRARAQEAGHGRRKGGSSVAQNGTVLEQSQILTTHNLAALTHALGLSEQLSRLAPDLVQQVFRWILRRHAQPVELHRARLQRNKNTAYAWRQAIYLLSLCEVGVQHQALAGLRALLDAEPGPWVERLSPFYVGLVHVINGGRFDERGRAPGGAIRWLGWSA